MKNEELRMKNGIVSAILTDITIRRKEVRLTPSGHSSNNAITQSSNHIYTLDLSSRPQATYLLTLTTADGKQHTVRLLKQSDIFGECFLDRRVTETRPKPNRNPVGVVCWLTWS